MSPHDGFFDTHGHALRDFVLCRGNATFANPGWEESAFRLLVLRLSPFRDVERSTPHLVLAREVRAEAPNAFIDMAFLPCPADAALMKSHGVPLAVGTQSHRSLAEFDVVFISNSHLLELVNLPLLLAGSGVPTWSSARGSQWPLLVLGGSNATAAHAVVKCDGDCMADALFFGEGEGKAARIATLAAGLRDLPRGEVLARIAAEVAGLWPAGDLSRGVTRAVAAEEEAGRRQGMPFPVLPGEEAGTARLAITLGCPSMCSFCFEGHDRKPFREIPREALREAARQIKLSTGAHTLEIESYNFNTHSRLPELLEDLEGMFLRVNTMSQRADILARTPGLLALELACDKRGFTLGVEGVSARQRRFLRKGLAGQDVRRALEMLHTAKVREVKLFYLLTGSESAADFDEFTDFLRWTRELRSRAAACPRLLFSFGLLVRMPATPLRHDGCLLDERAWRPIVGRAKSACETHGFEFRLASRWEEYAATQALAAGGCDAHEMLEGASAGEWVEARAADLAAEKPAGHPFPFAFLEDVESRGALARQYARAKAGRDGPAAAEKPGQDRDAVSPAIVARVSALMRRKHRLKPFSVGVEVPCEASGFGPQWLDAWLMRRLLGAHPDQAGNVLAMQEVLVGPWIGSSDVPWFGRAVVAVTAWDEASARAALAGVGAEAAEGSAAFETAHLVLELPGRFFPQAGPHLAAFMNGNHVPVTVERAGSSLAYRVGPKAARKKSLLGGSCTESPGAEAAILELRVGPRFPLAAFLASFPDPGVSCRALVEVQGLAASPRA